MKDGMQAGVSSACFFPQETACSVEKLAQWRIPQIEIFFNSFQELKPDYIERMRSCSQAGGTKIVSIHPFTSNSESFYFFTDYPGRLQDGLAIYRHFLQAAQQLQAQLLVFHGASVANDLSIERSARHFAALDRMAREEYGITVAYENVVRSRSREPQYLVQLREAYPQLKLVLDVKQALRAGHDPLEYVEQLGESIVHVHISDSTQQEDCLAVGSGNADLAALLGALQSKGFAGCVLQELYRNSYQEESEVKEGYLQLRQLIERVSNLPQKQTKFDKNLEETTKT